MTERIPEPKPDDPKEVFAFYGLAMFHAQVLEQELAIFTAMLVASGRTSLTRAFMQELFDRLELRTFGHVLSEARTLASIPGDLDAKLSEALRRRNVLAHHFFSQHSEDALSNAGRLEMLNELRNDIALFQELDALVVPIREPLSARLGVTNEVAEALLTEMRARASARDGAEQAVGADKALL